MGEQPKSGQEGFHLDAESELIQQRRKYLSDTFNEAVASGDQKKRMWVYMEWAKDRLGDDFNIKDLSNLEGVSLRNVIEEVVPQSEQEQALVKENKLSPFSHARFDVMEEAEMRWLFYNFGIKEKDIPRTYNLKDEDTGELFTFQSGQRELFEKKREELENLGHFAYPDMKITDDFKEYLQILRKKAQHE